MSGQVVQYPFIGGIDEKTADKWLDVGSKSKSIVNGVFAKNGAISKRFGYTALSKSIVNASNLSSADKLGVFKGEILAIDSRGAGSAGSTPTIYSWSGQANKFVTRSRVPNCTVTRSTLTQAASTLSAPDIAIASNGVVAYAWLVGADVWSMVKDSTTGAVLSTPQKIVTGSIVAVRLCAIGTTLIMLYQDSTSIYGRTLDATGGGSFIWSGASTLRSDCLGTPTFDVAAMSSTFALAYYKSAGTTLTINLLTYNSGLGVSAGPTSITDAIGGGAGFTPGGIGLRGTTGETLWLAYGCSNVAGTTILVKAMGRDPATLASTVAVQTLYSAGTGGTPLTVTCGRHTSTRALVVWGLSSFGSSLGDMGQGFITTAAAVTGVRTTRNIYPISKPIEYATPGAANTRLYGATQLCSSTQGTIFIVDYEGDATADTTRPARVVGTVAPRLALGSNGTYATMACSAVSPSSGVWGTLGSVTGTAVASGRLNLVEIDVNFADTAMHQNAEIGENLALSCGVPTFYDGTVAAEHGFFYYPEKSLIVATPQAAGGALFAGTYQYVFVYEWPDGKGQIHRSAGSVPKSVTTTTGVSSVDLTIPTLTLTERQNFDNNFTPEVAIVPYRTAVNGTIFYRLTPPGSNPTALTNNVNAASVSYTDTASDASIATNPLLYTTGGVLDCVCPPSSSCCIVHKNRIWLGGCDDGKAVWPSKSFTSREAPGFNEVLVFEVDDGGSITALGSLDDKLIIFKSDRIFVVYGDGPNDTGQGSDLTPPQKIASDVGCVDARSVVLTPLGLMFLGSQGIYVLTRALEVQFVGKNIETTLASYPTITSAVLVANQGHVRFTCVNAANTDGVTLVFDYALGEWSTFQIYDADNYGTIAPAAHAVMWSGVYTWSTPKGQLATEKNASSSAAYKDGSQYVTLTVEKGWIKTAGIAGYQRVRRVQVLADSGDFHDLTVQLAYNYSTSYVQSATWRNNDLVVLPREQVEMHVGSLNGATGKCEAIRVMINDAPPSNGSASTSGKGPILNAIALEVATKSGLYKPIPAGGKA